ncbi:MAG: repair protein RecN, partial [Actinomycetota bacterium]|nr:repair protein RecN [Actinomycetota bacterium]
MLCELMVDGLGVIDRAELSLPGGLIALTGETGAGKTLIVAALGLLLGDRADRSLIRSGSERALVEGRFLVSEAHAAAALLEEAGFGEPSGEVVVSREVFADDRPARARVNGRIATVGMLSEIGRLLVDVAGQHEHQRLADAGARRALLDAFAGEDAAALATEVRSSVVAAAAATARLRGLREGLSTRERELDVLRYEVEAIAAVDIKPGEIQELKQQAAIQEGAEALLKAIDEATTHLAREGGAQDLISASAAALERARSADGQLDELVRRLNEAAGEVGDVGSELARLAPNPDPESL